MHKSIGTVQHQKLLRLLRQVRTEAGLTQVQLAVRLSIDQSEISNWERGEKRLDLIELQQIVEAIGLTLPDFVDRFAKLTEHD